MAAATVPGALDRRAICLIDLPPEVLSRALAEGCGPLDIARFAAVARAFRASPAGEEGIRLWAQQRGIELPEQPEDENCAMRWLCFAALLYEWQVGVTAAAAERHSLFIDGEGRLLSCGDDHEFYEDEDTYGTNNLGHGPDVMRLNTPTRLPSTLGGEQAVSVSAAASHSLALTATGVVWSWGMTDLGYPVDYPYATSPRKVEALAGQRVVAISANVSNNLALTADGDVWGWGSCQGSDLPKKIEALAGQRIIAVTAGYPHSLALTADGAVWSWSDTQLQLLPKKIEAFAGQRVLAVSAGGYYSLAITADGAVWSWGKGLDGFLGHGDQQNQLLPKKVEAFAGQRVVAVSAGHEHSLAVTAVGTIWSWGKGLDGRLGHGDEFNELLPKKVEALASRRVVAVFASDCSSIAITAVGDVFTWGRGEDACLGHGEDLSNQLLPKKLEALKLKPPPAAGRRAPPTLTM